MSQRPIQHLAEWGAGLRLRDVPDRVVEHAKAQLVSIAAAAHAGYASELGPRIERAFPAPAPGPARAVPSSVRADPAHAAFLMAAWSMVLDYDDVMLGGHTGHSSVQVPLAYAQARGRGGAELLLAQIVANEIAARVNMAVAVGPLRGQMSGHLHLVGAAAARAKLERLAPDRFAAGIAFALSHPGRALYPSFLGSDAKVLCASWPVRSGVESVDAVRAGLRASLEVLDGHLGFFDTFADAAVPAFLGGLGERWHTETNSYKTYPASGYYSAALDAARAIVARHPLRADDVTAVEVEASLFTVSLDAHAARYLRGADTPVPALPFSLPYLIACAILDGDLTAEHLRRPRLEDPRAWALARKVELRHDERMTLEALRADIPLGAALTRVSRSQALRFLLKSGSGAMARRRAPADLLRAARLGWKVLRAVTPGRPLGDFRRAEKPLAARVRIRTRWGERFEEHVRVPEGFAGSGDAKSFAQLMHAKYLRCAAPQLGDARAREAADRMLRLEDATPEDVAALVDLCCA